MEGLLIDGLELCAAESARLCCVLGGFRRSNSRFGARKRASAIYNNLIAGLLSLSKSHTPALSLLCPEPRPRVFGRAARPALSQIQACGRGHVPFSCRIWSLAALHGTTRRLRYLGGEWAHLRELLFFFGKEEARQKKNRGKYYNFSPTPNRTQWHFFLFLTTP